MTSWFSMSVYFQCIKFKSSPNTQIKSTRRVFLKLKKEKIRISIYVTFFYRNLLWKVSSELAAKSGSMPKLTTEAWRTENWKDGNDNDAHALVPLWPLFAIGQDCCSSHTVTLLFGSRQLLKRKTGRYLPWPTRRAVEVSCPFSAARRCSYCEPISVQSSMQFWAATGVMFRRGVGRPGQIVCLFVLIHGHHMHDAQPP